MRKIKLILFTIALIWPFGQLLEIPFFLDISAHIYALDLLVFSLVISLIFDSQFKKIGLDPLTKPILLFSLIAFLSLILAIPLSSLNDLLIAFAYLLRWLSYTSIYFALRLLKPDQKIIKLVLGSLAVFTLLGLVQYLFLPDTRFLYYLGFDDHYYRLIGTFLDPNFTGLALVIFILLLLSSTNIRYKQAAIIPTIALALTFSRASFLVLFATTIYLALRSPQRIYLFIVSLVVIGLVLAPKPSGEGVNLLRTFSIYSRLNDTKAGLTLFTQKPFLGHGFNTLRSLQTESPIPDRASGGYANSFVFVLVTTGIIGFLAYLNLLYHLLKLTWQNPYLNASILAAILHSFFNHSLFYIWIMVLIWVIAALGIKGYKKL